MANGMHLFKNKTNLNFVNIYEYVSVHLEKYIERRALDCYDWLFWRGRKNRGGWGNYTCGEITCGTFHLLKNLENF